MEVNSREELEEYPEERVGEAGSVDGAAAAVNASASSQGATPPKDDPILEEFHDWKSQPGSSVCPDKIIELESLCRDSDGKASIKFNIDNTQKFTLYCPNNYPDYRGDEENFFLEAGPGLQLWCNAVNEFILDRNYVRLSDILSKSLSLYSNDGHKSRLGSTASNCLDSDDESESGESYTCMEEDGQLDDCLDKDFAWGIEIARRKKRWKEKEEEMRKQSKEENQEGKDRDLSLQEVYHDSSLRNSQPKQVFTSAAAFGILVNDIVTIMMESDALGIQVDSVDDNIFQWNVKISNFLGTPLDEDLRQIEKRFGYNYVELQLDFSKDLYPFFPPLVKVIRPRLQGSMMLRVTTMEILKLTYWNATKDMKSILTEIRNFLSTWARLEVNSERNDRVRYPMGAYNYMEHHLLRLALVSETVPRANKKYKVAQPPPQMKLPSTAIESRFERNNSTKKDDKLAKQNKWMSFCQKSKDKKKSDGEESPVKKMAKGVGYSSYNHKGWDINAYLAAKQEKDKQIELVLSNIIVELKRLHVTVLNTSSADTKMNTSGAGCSPQAANSSSTTNNNNDLNSNNSSSSGGSGGGQSNSLRRKRKLSPEEEQPVIQGGAATAAGTSAQSDTKCANSEMEGQEEEGPVNPISDLFSILEGSALIPFIESKLQANSFLEIGRHTGVYRQVVGIIRELCGHAVLRPLLAPLPDQSVSIHNLLQNLEQQANIMINRIGKASANGSVPKGKKKGARPDEELHGGAAAAPASASPASTNTSSEGTDVLAKEFQILAKEVGDALKLCGHTQLPMDHVTNPSTAVAMMTSAAGASASAAVTTNGHVCPEPSKNKIEASVPEAAGSGEVEDGGIEDDSVNADYCNALQGLQFDIIEFDESGPSQHFFLSECSKTEKPSYQSICRVAQDIASLSSKGSLPLNSSSSIFVRSDENKSTLLRVIITGPEDTPYTGGIFEFDIFFPNRYPTVPPKVHFRTTGGGAVRFNPNLYQEGKVCLSLLGTWDGAQGEQWNQDTSTILQVLISIQSLILCPEPYYNEPGFEKKYGTESGQQQCAKYNEDVLKNNLKLAILDAIKSPPKGFENIVRLHFYLKRFKLIKELEKQSENCGKSVKKLVAEVTAQLLAMDKPKSLP